MNDTHNGRGEPEKVHKQANTPTKQKLSREASRRADRLRAAKVGTGIRSCVDASLKAITSQPSLPKPSPSKPPVITSWQEVVSFDAFQPSRLPKAVKPLLKPSLPAKTLAILNQATTLAAQHHTSATKIQSAFRAKKARLILCAHYAMLAAKKIQASYRASKAREELSRNRGARTIQAAWRGYYPRLDFKVVLCVKKLHQASATKIQANWRTVPARRLLKEYKATVKIQSLWRRHFLRARFNSYVITKQAATLIQTKWRSYKCQHEYRLDLCDISITQRLARKYIARRQEVRAESALQIQKVARGYIDRKAYTFIRAKYIRQRSANAIQSSFRGYRVRKRVNKLRKILNAVVTIQKYWRAYDAQQTFWFFVGSLIEFQSIVRGVAARNHFTRVIQSVIILQCAVRVHFAKCNFQSRFTENKRFISARLIQNAWRSSVARAEFKVESSARKIQATWRCFIRRDKYLQWKAVTNAATIIQSAWRGFSCFCDFVLAVNDIINIQRVYRGHIARKIFKVKHEKRERRRARKRLRHRSALTIQRVYRGSVGREVAATARDAAQRYKAAVRIQSFWRSYDAQLDLFSAVGSAILIQSHVRCMIKRQTYIDSVGSIIISQCAVRQWIALRKCKQLQLIQFLVQKAQCERDINVTATKILQSWFRSTVHPKIINAAATKIQSFFRMVKAMVDAEIKAALRRHKIRKMLRNRTKEIDDMMLEDAWVTMSFETESLGLGDVFSLSNSARDATRRGRNVRDCASTVSGATSKRGLKMAGSGEDSLKHVWEPIKLSDESVCEVTQSAVKAVTKGDRSRRLKSKKTIDSTSYPKLAPEKKETDYQKRQSKPADSPLLKSVSEENKKSIMTNSPLRKTVSNEKRISNVADSPSRGSVARKAKPVPVASPSRITSEKMKTKTEDSPLRTGAANEIGKPTMTDSPSRAAASNDAKRPKIPHSPLRAGVPSSNVGWTPEKRKARGRGRSPDHHDPTCWKMTDISPIKNQNPVRAETKNHADPNRPGENSARSQSKSRRLEKVRRERSLSKSRRSETSECDRKNSRTASLEPTKVKRDKSPSKSRRAEKSSLSLEASNSRMESFEKKDPKKIAKSRGSPSEKKDSPKPTKPRGLPLGPTMEDHHALKQAKKNKLPPSYSHIESILDHSDDEDGENCPPPGSHFVAEETCDHGQPSGAKPATVIQLKKQDADATSEVSALSVLTDFLNPLMNAVRRRAATPTPTTPDCTSRGAQDQWSFDDSVSLQISVDSGSGIIHRDLTSPRAFGTGIHRDMASPGGCFGNGSQRDMTSPRKFKSTSWIGPPKRNSTTAEYISENVTPTKLVSKIVSNLNQQQQLKQQSPGIKTTKRRGNTDMGKSHFRSSSRGPSPRSTPIA